MVRKKIRIKEGKVKRAWKEIWDFLWNSNSIWSWIADLALLYLIVKFVFFPLLGLIFATSLPSVIVQSGSMEHGIGGDGLCGVYFNQKEKIDFDKYWQTCGEWYEEYDITKSEFLTWSYYNGIDIGDIIIVSGRWEKNLEVGDIIVFDANQPLPIIHRVIDINPISTKGDHNKDQLPGGVEENILKEKIVGKAIFRIPKVGWAKLFFVKLLTSFKS